MPRQLVRDFGTALRFGTTSSVVASGTTPTVTTGLTVCFWFNPDSWSRDLTASSTRRVFRTTDDNIDLFARQSASNYELKFQTTEGSTPRAFISESYFTPHRWHFIVVQYTAQAISQNLQVYVDGTLAGFATRDGTNISCNNTWSVGDSAGTAACPGMYDEFQVFNFAFTSDQRSAAQYQGTYPSTGKVVYYKFDEGSGTSATDSSGNAKTGTISNATYTTDVVLKPRTAAGVRPQAVKLLVAQPSSPDTDGHNGIMTDGTNFYACGDPQIKKFDASWSLLATNDSAAADAGVQHLGDGQYYNGFLYIAAENYSSPVSYDHQRIAKYNASDLSLVTTYDISAQGYEISGLAIDPIAGIIYVSSYVQSDRVAKYSLSSPGTYLGDILLSQTITQSQCIAYKNGRLYLGANGMTPTNAIWEVEMNGRVTGNYIKAVKTNQEGLDWSTSIMYALDEQTTTQTVWSVYPVSNRPLLNGNLVPNGNFERYPSFVGSVASTGDNKWIDGTDPGANYGDSLYRWATNNGTDASSAQYDTTTFHSGSASMKISSVSAGKSMEVALYRDDTSADHVRFGISVQPNTSYTLTYYMKTELVSGDSNDGLFMAVRQFDKQGGNVSTTSHTKVKTTTDWTLYTLTFTTAASTAYLSPRMTLVGNTGTATLLMNGWFDDLDLHLTTPVTRTAVT